MRSEVNCGAVIYRGYDPKDNGSWIIEEKGEWTYVCYQRNEFTKVISGYVVKQTGGEYRAFNCMETYNKLFSDKRDAIRFVQKKYEEEEGARQ